MEVSEILVLMMFGTFLVFLFSGYPIAFVLGGVGVLFTGVGYYSDIYFDTITGLDYTTLGLIANRVYKLVDNWILVALPMFIYMGLMLDRSAIAEKLMHSMQELFGAVRGGLAITVTMIGVILAASTGIIGASVVLLGVLSVPAMLNQGYNKELAVGVVCGAGCLGILIPPSIMLIIMSDQLGLSVGDLFMGAVFPGLILGGLYTAYILILGILKPDLVPLAENRRELSFMMVANVLKDILPPLLLIISVLGSIFMGVATPTEASGVGAFGAMLLAAYNKKLSWHVLRETVQETLRTTGFIFGIFVGATCFALVLRELGGDEFIEGLLNGLPFGPMGILISILGLVFFLGFFLDWIEITLIVLPLLAPVVSGMDFGISDYGGAVGDAPLVWFAVLVAVTLQTSFLTPPVGFALFYLKGVTPPEIKLEHLYRGVIPFVILQLIGLTIVVMYPSIVTWLPSVAY
ncbi:MAG: TRAP transporter large permease subunit [SAR324 cluster bacterium]|nr:TRAP transporter large permease subunit [SAR324 cluster bacterium]